ncbi:uncharacterized protein FIBRA_01077 [Fibroporia radiculosa]|uniref:Uncharacterized protein n=1 Tax=Fibroporia radiculosa TaxID=599839 RepID=J4GJ92_9APHY|nr:uncharacterized protein FIBRA_01077 [Fibroporia radiculosa]CCL99065.1 predicted protein [Fibroporia radiculosa]
MYKILRRISSSFFPRPDRPWSEDATSTAPQIGRKRRMSSPEPDADPDTQPSAKRRRADSPDASDDASHRDDSPARVGKAETETEEVKQVTKGVGEVELDEGSVPETPSAAEAAAIPLPDSPVLPPTETTDEIESQSPPEESAAILAVKDEGEVVQQADGTTDLVELSTVGAAEEESHDTDADAEGEDEIPGLTAGSDQNSPTAVDRSTHTEKAGPVDAAASIAIETSAPGP